MNNFKPQAGSFLLKVALVVGLFGLVVGFAAAADKAKTKLVFAIDATFPPMEFVDDQKQIVGFDPDLVAALAKVGGFDYELKNADFSGIFGGLNAGSYDAVISSITITAERKKTMDFSLPYLNAGQVIVVAKNNTAIQKSSDLVGKNVGVAISTTGDIEVSKIKGLFKHTYDEIGHAMQDLTIGRLDAVVIDSPTATNFALQADAFKDKLKVVGNPINSEEYGIVIKKGNAKVLNEINKGLDKILKDGTVKKLKQKWGIQ